jgi:YD repeat-containing protein
MQRVGEWIVAVLIILSGTAQAQLLDNSEAKTFGEDPFFNRDFIERNKIHSIHGMMSGKKTMDRIREGKVEYHYDFDSSGKLSMQLMAMRRKTGRIDSSIVNYEYSPKGTVTVKRRNDAYGFYSYAYELNDEEQVIKETYCRDENAGPSRFAFEQGKRFIISSESFSYDQPSDTVSVQKVYNNYGKAYMVNSTFHNFLGYKLRDESRFIVNNKRSQVQYQYDIRGRINKKIEYNTVGDTTNVTHAYSYDDVGNLLEENTYHSGIHKSIRQFIYDGNMLMTAMLTKDVETDFISIIQYSYSFFE